MIGCFVGPPGGMMFAMEKEDYTPYQMAIATAFNDTEFAYGIDFQHVSFICPFPTVNSYSV